MVTATILLEIDDTTAKAYASKSTEEQKKLRLLLTVWLRELTSTPTRTLQEVMDRLSENAEARGLTPEELESILNED